MYPLFMKAADKVRAASEWNPKYYTGGALGSYAARVSCY